MYIGLDEFMQILENRLEKSIVPNPGLVAKKVRKVGNPSVSVAPSNAPVSAVRCETSE